MMPERRHDVVILGGGPGGSATAISLARLGFDVAVVERAVFPRPHVGICLADQTLALLDHLGIGDSFRAAGFWRRRTTAVRWAQGEVHFVDQSGYHVDRGTFDRMMLDHAGASSVTVYQPACFEGLRPAEIGGWEGRLSHDGREQPLATSFLVDAAGRRSALPGTRVKDGSSLVALHGLWHLDRSGGFDGMIASGRDGWAWFAKTNADRAIVSIFVDPVDARAGGRDRLMTTYTRLLQQFPPLMDALRGSALDHVDVCDASSLHSGEPVGDRFIRVGDAAMCVDPLSSQGVHLALQSGIQAAIVTNTIRHRPDGAELARRFYRDRIGERVEQLSGRTTAEYLRGAKGFSSAFWRRRAGDASAQAEAIVAPQREAFPEKMPNIMSLAREVSVSSGPVIAGNFVEARPMLSHPNLVRPVAYVGGNEIAPLLACLPPRFSLDVLPNLWRDHIDTPGARRIASWLWQHSLVVETDLDEHRTARANIDAAFS